jgi:DNA-binding NarL/FixJ family response regulator
VDDHPLMREGITAVIQNEPDMLVVGEASNGQEASQEFRTHHPDITLMDLRLPDKTKSARYSTALSPGCFGTSV